MTRLYLHITIKDMMKNPTRTKIVKSENALVTVSDLIIDVLLRDKICGFNQIECFL